LKWASDLWRDWSRAAAEQLLEFLSADKGKRVVRRVFPRLSEVQRLLFFGALIRVFDRLDVVSTPIQSQVPCPTEDEAARARDQSLTGVRSSDHRARVPQVAVFMDNVMAPVGALLSRLPFALLPATLETMLDTMTLFGVFNMARSRVGVAFLQQFLLRAEELKQQGAATPEELADWCAHMRTLSAASQRGPADRAIVRLPSTAYRPQDDAVWPPVLPAADQLPEPAGDGGQPRRRLGAAVAHGDAQ